MNMRRVAKFLSNPAIDFAWRDTRMFVWKFCRKMRRFPTPRFKLCEDGAVRIRWVNGPRAVRVYVRGEDVNFHVDSSKSERVPDRIPEAVDVFKAVRLGLVWLTEEAGDAA